MDGWVGGWVGGGGEYTSSYSSFYHLTTVFHVVAFRVVTSELLLPRCRFRVVAREKERGSHVHEASVPARTFSSLYMPVCTLYTPVYSR